MHLREVGQAVGFNVFWDGEVQVESDKPYTGEAPVVQPEPDTNVEFQTQATEDYSAQANPAIFTGPYTKEAYNALREAMIKGKSNPVTMTEETQTAMSHVEAAMGCYPFYELESLGGGQYAYVAKKSQAYTEADALCQELLDSLSGKTEEEKLYAFACEISKRLEYKADAWTSPNTLFATPGPHQGNCTSYSQNFKFLCDLIHVPCTLVHSDDHQWNEVYVNGSWYCVDITGFDVDITTSSSPAQLLYHYEELQGAGYQQSDSLLTQVEKELLVPGSTK